MRFVLRFAAVFICFAASLQGFAADSVASFVYAYERAIVARVSSTARVSCKYYSGNGQVLPKEINGVVTFGGYQNPFSIMTLRREETLVDRSLAETLLLSSRGEQIRMSDGGRCVYYDENVAGMGASMVSSRLDDLFMILMYPEILDRLKMAQGSVTEETYGSVRRIRARIEDVLSSYEMVVDADTYLPFSIERVGSAADGSDIRAVMTFSDIRVTGRLPPDVLFDVNLIFGFKQQRYDPLGMYAKAPDFVTDMMDGSQFSLAANRGKPVILCFRGAGDSIGFSRDMYLDKAGDMARKRGGIFIDVYPSVSARAIAVEGSYSAVNTCRNDVLARLFRVDLNRAPCVILITPDGRVGDVMIGYVPGFSEHALDELLDAWLPPLSSAGESVEK